MTLLIIVVLLITLLSGGYYGHKQWGPPGALGVAGVVVAIALLLWLIDAI